MPGRLQLRSTTCVALRLVLTSLDADPDVQALRLEGRELLLLKAVEHQAHFSTLPSLTNKSILVLLPPSTRPKPSHAFIVHPLLTAPQQFVTVNSKLVKGSSWSRGILLFRLQNTLSHSAVH